MRKFVFLLLLLFSFSAPVRGENLPIVIESQKLTYNEKERVAVYIGNVIAQHGKTTLRGDKLTIYFDSSGKEIRKIVVEGNVSVEDPRGRGRCDKLIYYPYQEKVVLVGNAKLVQDKNVLIGDKIVAYRDGRVEVIGQKRKVKTVIFPKESSGGSGKGP
jgi:lipopolysaccharide export system protein LptA